MDSILAGRKFFCQWLFNLPEKVSNRTIKRLLKFAVFGLGVGLALLLCAVVFLLVKPTRFDFGWLKEPIDRQLTAALGRDVSIEGDIVLMSGTSPSLLVGQVVVANPAGWEGNLATLQEFRTQIGLGELVRKQIKIDDLTVDGLEIALAVDDGGRKNWQGLFGRDAEEAGATGVAVEPESDEGDQPDEGVVEVATPEADAGAVGFQLAGLGRLTISGLKVTKQDGEGEKRDLLLIDQLDGTAPETGAVQLLVEGHVLELPFSGRLSGGGLKDLLAATAGWPVDFDGQVGEATVKLSGGIAAGKFEANPASQFEFSVPDIELLETLTGPLPRLGELTMKGELRRSSADRMQLSLSDSVLGDSPLSATVDVDLSGSLPRVGGEIELAFVDLNAFRNEKAPVEDPVQVEEEAVEAPTPPAATSDKEPAVVKRDSILPVVGEFELRVGEVTNARTAIENISLALAVERQQGAAKVSVEFAEASLDGELEMTLVDAGEVGLGLVLNGRDADLSGLVRYYSGDDRFSGRVDQLQLRVDGAGVSEFDAWANRSVEVEVREASMEYRGDDKTFEFSVERGLLNRGASAQPQFVSNGTLGESPWDLDIQFRDRDGALARMERVEARLADLKLSLERKDQGQGNMEVMFALSGERLDRLNPIYELDLPPLGPYSLSGEFSQEDSGYAIQELSAKVGKSRMSGSLRLTEREGKAPLAEIDLDAEMLQLDDFRFEDWSAVGEVDEPAPAATAEGDQPVDEPEPARVASAGDASAEPASEIPSLLSHEMLSALDAEVALAIGSFYSGRDKWGSGTAKLSMRDGRIELERLVATQEDSTLNVALLFHPKADGTLDWHASMATDGFDYGYLARLIDPDSENGGALILDLDIGAKGVPFGGLHFAQATGQLDFDFCPTKLEAGILDLWATNVIVAVLPKLDPEGESVINCIIGRLDLKDGVVTPDTLGLDTTTLRVFTEGSIDIAGDRFDLTMTPFPKRAQLLSLEAPVMLKGSLTKPEITLGELALTRTAVRMTKNAVLFPLKTLAGERLPADGSDICGCKLGYTPDPAPEGGAGEPEAEGQGGRRRRLRLFRR